MPSQILGALLHIARYGTAPASGLVYELVSIAMQAVRRLASTPVTVLKSPGNLIHGAIELLSRATGHGAQSSPAPAA